MFALTGCGGVSVYNVQSAPIEATKNVTQDKVYKAIKNAGHQRGWRVSKIKPGLAKAYINVRGKHEATVEIPYSAKEFSINYLSSSHLKYNAEDKTIHKNYNSWVKNLYNSIQNELSMMEE
jgi:hypothetical protein